MKPDPITTCLTQMPKAIHPASLITLTAQVTFLLSYCLIFNVNKANLYFDVDEAKHAILFWFMVYNGDLHSESHLKGWYEVEKMGGVKQSDSGLRHGN